MSQSEHKSAGAVDFVSEVNSALVGGDVYSSNSTPKPATAPEASTSPKPQKKSLSKKAKVALLVAGWILLLGIAAGVALLLKPAPEIVYTDAIVEAYKFSGLNSAEILDTVDDLDYYGYYVPNPLAFTLQPEGGEKGAYLISGLKNKSIEDKINNRILAIAREYHDIAPERDGVSMDITANYFNILSFTIEQYDYDAGVWHNAYFTFDLNTGEELNFDNLFSENLNLTSLLFNSFYDSLSTSIQFNRLYAERSLAAEQYFPDPAQCNAQYCPSPGETYDDLRARIATYDAQLANIEQIAIDAIQKYLAGEKRFYLNSFGPAFVLDDGTVVEMELKDNIRYAVYLKNYRSDGPLFEDGLSDSSNPFFTEIPTSYQKYLNEETDDYLFDYTESISSDNIISPSIRQAFRDYLKNKGLSAPGEEGKFRYVSASGAVAKWDNLRIGYATLCVNETDKAYYDSVYRKVIIDKKVQRNWLAPLKAGRYDENRVIQLPVDGSTEACSQQKSVAITDSGAIIEDVDGILVDSPALSVGWEDYLKRKAYHEICASTWNPHCYTEAEKQSHEFVYIFSGGAGITMNLKDNSESGSSYFYSFGLNAIPQQYFNPEIVIK